MGAIFAAPVRPKGPRSKRSSKAPRRSRELQASGICAIAASPPACPKCIRFRPKAYDSYGAVTALATDSDGNVLAVHQIYVTADGAKAPLDVIKRTNKLTDGWSKRAAVRCPGANPLVLAEGIETALSVWQATGHETWACLGIANIGHAPVPEEEQVYRCARWRCRRQSRDRAAPQSHGQARRRRGVHVRLAEPPRGKDFNDVLVDEGKNAVRDLIASGIRRRRRCGRSRKRPRAGRIRPFERGRDRPGKETCVGSSPQPRQRRGIAAQSVATSV